MNRRDAKRMACREAARLLEDRMALPLASPDFYEQPDIERAQAALKELINEMWRRGGVNRRV